MGALLVTERGKNIGDLFTPGKEVLTYQSVEEAVRVTKEALRNLSMLSEVAKAGQQRTLKDHTFARRAHEMHKVLTNLIENTDRASS
jgi:spore maturation protein CgeB